MTIKEEINRGVELLLLCQNLQSEKDGIQRPVPFQQDPTTTLDDFAMEIAVATSNMKALHELVPMMYDLLRLGEKLVADGAIEQPLLGARLPRAALDYILAQHGLPKESPEPDAPEEHPFADAPFVCEECDTLRHADAMSVQSNGDKLICVNCVGLPS